MNTLAAIAAVVIMSTLAGPVAAETLVGRATVTDGDTIEIGGERIRLHGVDAPESAQECLDEDGQTWRCGQAAAMELASFLEASRPTSCEVVDVDQYGRLVAICWRADATSVNEWLVGEGWALDYAQHSGGAYADLETVAAAGHRGIWIGTFDAPWDWRAGSRNGQTEVRALAGAPGDCVIKGNINSDGVRIYHIPGWPNYEDTVIDPSRGERWFCSEEEAVAAGWRAPRF